MHDNDKNSLVIVGYIVLMLITAVLGYLFGSRVNNLLIILAVLIVLQQVLVIPLFVKRYRELYSSKIGLLRFIPVINEINVLPSFYAWGTLILSLLCIASIIVFFTPITFGDYMGLLQFKNINIYFMISTFLLTCIVRGAGYINLIIDIQKNNEKFTNTGYTAVDMVNIISYITVFIPCMRVIGISYQLNVLQKFHLHGFTAYYDNSVDYGKLL